MVKYWEFESQDLCVISELRRGFKHRYIIFGNNFSENLSIDICSAQVLFLPHLITATPTLLPYGLVVILCTVGTPTNVYMKNMYTNRGVPLIYLNYQRFVATKRGPSHLSMQTPTQSLKCSRALASCLSRTT